MMPSHIDPADVLFVGTDLTVLSEGASPSSLDDVTVEGRTYRPLDPAYYAWLRHRMGLAKAACDQGRLLQSAFEALRLRFNARHDQAVALFGEPALLDAMQQLDPAAYPAPGQSERTTDRRSLAERVEAAQEAEAALAAPAAPSSAPSPSPSAPVRPRPARSFSYPAAVTPDLPCDHRVTPAALAAVDAIRDQALALGWTEAELYQTRSRFTFPCGNQHGLVCYVDADHQVGQVTSTAIEILCRGGAVQRFYRRTR